MANQADLISNNLSEVKARINALAPTYNRDPNHILLLAVSKTKPVSDIVTAYNCGHRHFGENYVQEAVDKIKHFGENYVQESVEKIQSLSHLKDISWHFIGPLQSNKSKFIAEYFDWMHSLERLKIAKRLNEQRSVYQEPLNVCVQVNIDDENNKAGIPLDEVKDFVSALSEFTRIRCRGLMTIPKAGASISERQHSFANMQKMFLECASIFPDFDTLSMGMSQDIDLAIANGSTILRVGTDIFGKRPSLINN